MRFRVFLILITFLIFGLSSISAQTPPPKKINAGVVNGKATNLPRPTYPAAAQAVKASGVVNVQVTIDETGKVVAASAVSGHPLLRQAAEDAAFQATFNPTTLSGQPVSVTGIIVYNFVSAMTMNQVGYELSLAEKSKFVQKYQINSISGTLPPSWTEEKELLKKLESVLVEKTAPDADLVKPAATSNATDKPAPTITFRGNSSGTATINSAESPRAGIAVRIGTSYDGKHPVSSDALAIIVELQAAFEKRLSVRENILWSFKLGEVLGKLKAALENGESTQSVVSELNQLSANTPMNTPQIVTEKINELVETSNQKTTDIEKAEKMSSLIENLRNIKSY
ncbi:MAG: energy transducer TonB [Acidobacteriota bacterium]|nr:energy transducer TonB [Acidobacteriota bacterium]